MYTLNFKSFQKTLEYDEALKFFVTAQSEKHRLRHFKGNFPILCIVFLTFSKLKAYFLTFPSRFPWHFRVGDLTRCILMSIPRFTST